MLEFNPSKHVYVNGADFSVQLEHTDNGVIEATAMGTKGDRFIGFTFFLERGGNGKWSADPRETWVSMGKIDEPEHPEVDSVKFDNYSRRFGVGVFDMLPIVLAFANAEG